MWMLLHGFTGAPQSWDPVIAAASLDREPSRPWLCGHGPDWQSTRTSSFEDEVGRLGALAEELPPPRFLGGYSLGARVALGLLVSRPDLFEGALMIGVHPGLRSEEQRRVRREADRERAEMLRFRGLPAFVSYWEDQPIFATQQALSEPVRERQRAIRLAHDPEGLAHSLEALGLAEMPDLSNALGPSGPRILLMAGDRDIKFRTLMTKLAEGRSRVRAIAVSGTGHNVPLECPEAVAGALARVAHGAEERLA